VPREHSFYPKNRACGRIVFPRNKLRLGSADSFEDIIVTVTGCLKLCVCLVWLVGY